jgi:hypothetical protein
MGLQGSRYRDKADHALLVAEDLMDRGHAPDAFRERKPLSLLPKKLHLRRKSGSCKQRFKFMAVGCQQNCFFTH